MKTIAAYVHAAPEPAAPAVSTVSADYVGSCPCGRKHDDEGRASGPGKFYVSVEDGPKKFNVVAGPYDTHAEALAVVEPVKRLAIDGVDGGPCDPYAHFYSWGTVRMPGGTEGNPGYTAPGLLNERLAAYLARGGITGAQIPGREIQKPRRRRGR